ncbi:MAG: SDR family oxidoreductase [Anaerolineae bacterium]
MDLGLQDKVAMVAASSKGLGKAVAMGLAREGAKVSICARTEEQLNATADEIREATGSPVLAMPTDVTKRDEIDRWMERTVAELGPPLIAVSNAGGPPPGNFFDLHEEQWRAAFDLMLMSAVHLAYKTLPYMREAGWGRIITITSISVKMPLDNLMLSNAIRMAVIGLTKSLSNELAGEGITVNSVLPGWTLTERVEQLLNARADREGISVEEAAAGITQNIPAGRMGRPQEFGDVVTFLASERAGYINGAALQIDGGYYKAVY